VDTEEGSRHVNADKASVCVIIPAWNAEKTIGRAINSALDQKEVDEVFVVDDASTDATVAVASASCDGTQRLRVIRQAQNSGPSAARNLAIAQSTAPYLAILDSDDFFLPGRFAPLLTLPGWDALADNLAFIKEAHAPSFDAAKLRMFDTNPKRLSLAEFVRGNISHPNRPRAELGFAKPLIKRAFLDKHDLRYDENLRLGEDYALYARILTLGGAFLQVQRCGYIAVERGSSLSANHRTADLLALLAFDKDLLNIVLDEDTRSVIHLHMIQLNLKVNHRNFLHDKKINGFLPAMFNIMGEPQMLFDVAKLVLRDKLEFLRGQSTSSAELRYLFN
jgi:succinoglycan biosynthesis protein ExoU